MTAERDKTDLRSPTWDGNDGTIITDRTTLHFLQCSEKSGPSRPAAKSGVGTTAMRDFAAIGEPSDVRRSALCLLVPTMTKLSAMQPLWGGPLNWSQLFTWNSTGAVQTARKIWRLPACE